MKSTPGNLHRRFDRLLRSAELVRNIEEGEAAKWTNHDSRIRKKSNHDPPGKKLPRDALRKKSREPSCQSRRQIASKLNLFYQTPDIPVFESNQSSINFVNLQI